jgi:5-methylcytosine-specific restriction endonuclease McrBC regulatory subunit McrC
MTISTRLKELQASVSYIRGRLDFEKNHQHKAIYRKNLHYALQEYNKEKESHETI